MMRLSGQQGVPVITVDDQVVVGFDRRRLEQLLPQDGKPGSQLGVLVADATPRVRIDGAFIGDVKVGSPADKTGLKAGDIIISFRGQPVRNAADLERLAMGLQPGARVQITYLRAEQHAQTEVVF
jgi:S1-C subfamily serine protease